MTRAGGGGCPLHGIDPEAVLAVARRTFQRPRPDGRLPRQFHEKAHACLTGELMVEPPADAALRHGLFAHPGRHPAIVRLSSSFFADDRQPDGRGMAIKLAGVDGAVMPGAPSGQQDFILIDQPTAAFGDAAAAAAMFRALDGVPAITPERLLAPAYVVPGWDPRRIRWRYLRLVLAIGLDHFRGRGLEAATYYSTTPYRLGGGAVKYLCRPVAGGWRSPRDRRLDLATRLQAVLDRGPIRFEFCVQPRRDAGDPLDDASVAWTGPAHRVGHLEIAPQRVADGIGLSDGLAFSPWNCLAAHEPLGSLNALRRLAYADSAGRRGGDPAFPAIPPGPTDRPTR